MFIQYLYPMTQNARFVHRFANVICKLFVTMLWQHYQLLWGLGISCNLTQHRIIIMSIVYGLNRLSYCWNLKVFYMHHSISVLCTSLTKYTIQHNIKYTSFFKISNANECILEGIASLVPIQPTIKELCTPKVRNNISHVIEVTSMHI